jgi:ribosomal protein L11 methylase PrmA
VSALPSLRAFALRGPDANAVLDWLYVHGDIAGVLEQPELVVWLREPVPAWPAGRFEVEEREVRPQDFTHTGLEHDRAIVLATDLVVRPPWVAAPAGFAGVELLVPRGSAFGSGEHASTQAALLAMHRTWSRPASLADVGTGSGILALYARVRGCAAIAACDVDAASVAAARDLLPFADVFHGGPDRLAPADMVVANMTGAELLAALPAVLAIWTARAPLVLGGMRAPEVDGIVRAVPAAAVHREVVGAFTAVVFPGGAQGSKPTIMRV